MKYIIENKSDIPDIFSAWFAASAYIDLIHQTKYFTANVDGFIIASKPIKKGMRKIIIYNE